MRGYSRRDYGQAFVMPSTTGTMICQIVDGEVVVGALHVVRIEACVLLVNLDSSRVQIVERSMAADAYLARRADRSYYRVSRHQSVRTSFLYRMWMATYSRASRSIADTPDGRTPYTTV